MITDKHCVFVAGGTGYVGRPLIERLLQRGHTVRALARPGSQGKVPPGCEIVLGNALDASTYSDRIRPADTFVQLVGVAHPSPAKAAEFRSIDLPSASGAIQAAAKLSIEHFIYVSVAHPAPVMKAYVEVRTHCERLIHERGLNATILRPWYVLGPGHRWPYLLIPIYWLAGLFPLTREGSQRLGLVTREDMINGLVQAVEYPVQGIRIIEVPEIRASRGVSRMRSASPA